MVGSVENNTVNNNEVQIISMPRPRNRFIQIINEAFEALAHSIASFMSRILNFAINHQETQPLLTIQADSRSNPTITLVSPTAIPPPTAPISDEAALELFNHKLDELRSKKDTIENYPRAVGELLLQYATPPSRWNRIYPTAWSLDAAGRGMSLLTRQCWDLLNPEELLSIRQGLSLTEGEYTMLRGPISLFFRDDEIIAVLARRGEPLPSGKIPLQQAGKNGCSYGAVAMLATDLLGEIQEVLPTSAVTDTTKMYAYLRKLDLEPIESRVGSLEELQEKINQNNCSAIINYVDDIGSHYMIVDGITDEGVNMRDPYHGWAIKVTTEAFKRIWSPNRGIIQARKAAIAEK